MNIFRNKDECLEMIITAISRKRIYLWLQDDVSSDNIMALPWRELWCESSDYNIIKKIHEQQLNSGYWPVERQVLPVVRDPDDSVTGSFSFDRLLPVYFLHGVTGGEYDDDLAGISKRRRKNIRERMLERMAEIRQGTFVVAGGDNHEHLMSTLNDVLDDAFLPDVSTVDLVLISECLQDIDLSLFSARQQNIYLWQGSVEEFTSRTLEIRSRSPRMNYQHQMKVGPNCIGIDDLLVGMSRRIDEDYYLIELTDLDKPASVSVKLLTDFLGAPDPCWPGFAAGICFERQYQPLHSARIRAKLKQHALKEELNKLSDGSLLEVVESAMELSTRDFGKNITITVPAEPGCGITTMLCSTAYEIARSGYPVLMLRPGTRDIDFNALTAFLTGLSRRSRDQNAEHDGRSVKKEVPVLLIFDAEHQGITLTREIAERLRNDGRLCVVLRAVEPIPEIAEDDWRAGLERSYCRARGIEVWCDNLLANVSPGETGQLSQHFAELITKHNIELDLPDANEWREYQRQQTIRFPGRRQEQQVAESLFWVCLHFFLIKQIRGSDRLSEQLESKMKGLRSTDPKMASYIYSIAVSTVFRIALPTKILAHAYSVSNWVALSEDIKQAERIIPYLARDYGSGDEEYLRFRHTQLARMILYEFYKAQDREGFALFKESTHIKYPVEWLNHLINKLEPGNEVHRNFGKMVATQVLKLEGKRKDLLYYADSLLDSFSQYPLHYLQQSQTVLQAYGITLSKSISGNPELGPDEICRRYTEAVEKVNAALKLVDSDNDSEEDPRVLKTTMGNIYESWARREFDNGNSPKGEELAEKAAVYYMDVFKDWPDNVYARYGYSLVLYKRYISRLALNAPENMDDLVEALECLDMEPNLDFEEQWEKHRLRILEQIDTLDAEDRLVELMQQGMEMAYVLQVRRILKEPENWNDELIDKVVPILEEAGGCSQPSKNPNSRLSLLYRVVSYHSQRRWDFAYRYRLLTEMQRNAYYFTNQFLYEYAVLCYQLDRQEEGERLFSVMRRGQRYLQLNLEKYEYWREIPEKQGELPVRVCTMRMESADSAFNGWARVVGIKRMVPFNPSHPWRGKPVKKTPVPCIVRFRQSGPQAVPQDFFKEGGADAN
ncbi:MAG: hypothetical protein PHZ03_06550 [Syntrophomonas sp.]|nr:hypothetical protein [Syntrophomonas sp.]